MLKATIDPDTGKLRLVESRSRDLCVRCEAWTDPKGRLHLLEKMRVWVTDPSDKRVQIPNPVITQMYLDGYRPTRLKGSTRRRTKQRRNRKGGEG